MQFVSSNKALGPIKRTILMVLLAFAPASAMAQGSQSMTFSATAGQTIAIESSLASCVRRAQIMPFLDTTLQVDGVRFNFDAQPPATFPGGAALAALYQIGSNDRGEAMGQFCVDGACLANGNTCSAIAFVQPNGIRIFTRQ